MLILASLSGIQAYLFDVREAGGKQARSLRNRSFRIQLLAECVALRLLDSAKLPRERLLFCAAAKVCIDAADLSPERIQALRDTAAEMEALLLTEAHGRLRLSVAFQDSSGSFEETFDLANRALVVEKVRPFARAAIGNDGAWRGGSLILAKVWDADADAERDAEIGRRLVKAQWLTIRRAGRASHSDGLDALGLTVEIGHAEPESADGLVSYSNLRAPHTPARSIDRRLFHPRRLARHVPLEAGGNAIEFVELAAQSRGAAMLGVLKADVDSLGAAVSATLRRANGNAAAALRKLSEYLDQFFAETLEAVKEDRSAPWANIYTVFSGGDDMLVVGPWDVVLDFAGQMQHMFSDRFGLLAQNRPSATLLTISAGVALIKPKYPIHLATAQADELLERAKTELSPRADQPKDQCAALGSVWKWQDHGRIIGAGKQLADWVKRDGNPDGVIQRGWLHTLLELALLRRGQAGPEYAGVHPAVAASRLAYHVARNWPKAGRQGDPAPPARQWIDDILREFDQYESTCHVDTTYLPAIVRYALLATRSGSLEERS